MPKLPFMQVDAFTNQPISGNACAIVFESDALDSDTMQAIAREQNLSETAFVRRSNKADFGVRYFTPAEEIPLAGHPTIATTYALVETGRVRCDGNHKTITLDLPAGIIPVEVFQRNGAVERIVMSQLPPQFLDELVKDDVAAAVGLKPEDMLAGLPAQIVSTGTPQLMIALNDLATVRRSVLDIEKYMALRQRCGFFSAHLFCLEGISSGATTFARHYGIPPDLIEDPFTGSATGGMGAYLWHYGLIEEPQFVAEQGHDMGRPGRGFVEVIGPRHAIETVKIGGPAVTVIRGEMELP